MCDQPRAAPLPSASPIRGLRGALILNNAWGVIGRAEFGLVMMVRAYDFKT